MKKHLVLLAILLPFSGYAIIKEERMDQIDELGHIVIWNGLRDWMYVLCKYQCIDLMKLPEDTREWFLKQMEDVKNKMAELDKEYKELEQK